jgi:hypothetical protein
MNVAYTNGKADTGALRGLVLARRAAAKERARLDGLEVLDPAERLIRIAVTIENALRDIVGAGACSANGRPGPGSARQEQDSESWEPRVREQLEPRDKEVAIVGIGCRLPGGARNPSRGDHDSLLRPPACGTLSGILLAELAAATASTEPTPRPATTAAARLQAAATNGLAAR